MNMALVSISMFWIGADTDDVFFAGYSKIAEHAKLGTADTVEELCKSVQRWLDSASSGKWLLVVDNLDDVDLNSTRWMPCRRGNVLFTTRDGRIIGKHVPTSAAIKVDIMTLDESRHMFSTLTNTGSSQYFHSQEDVDTLLEYLDYFPLAISHAAAFVRETGYPIHEYLDLLRDDQTVHAQLITDGWEATTSENLPQAVKSTWDVTFHRLQQSSSLAVEILRFMSVIDNHYVPRWLVQNAFPTDSHPTSVLAEAIRWLLGFSLASQPAPDTYKVHNLVAFYTKENMSSEDVLSSTVLQWFELFAKLFPDDPSDPAKWPQYTELLPHGEALSKLCTLEAYSEYHHIVTHKISYFHGERGQFGVALDQLEDLLKSQARHLGQNDRLILETRYRMGRSLEGLGRWSDSLAAYQSLLDIQKNVLGHEHPDTLKTIYGIAVAVGDMGDHAEVLSQLRSLLDTQRRILGHEHPDTLLTLKNIEAIKARSKLEHGLEATSADHLKIRSGSKFSFSCWWRKIKSGGAEVGR